MCSLLQISTDLCRSVKKICGGALHNFLALVSPYLKLTIKLTTQEPKTWLLVASVYYLFFAHMARAALRWADHSAVGCCTLLELAELVCHPLLIPAHHTARVA
ncbi:MAG: hypothetical protein BWY19_00077 [bacterium ADurb.Bin212]|nr:MAG: hypothetical protein BWY19_00077 [bacterium ADurb.Bin212]